MITRALKFHTVNAAGMAGNLYLPDEKPPFPAVLLCQGLSGVKHLVLPSIAEKFASVGIASLAFDYRGRGESEGDPELVDPRARVEDALYALATLLDQKEVDGERVGVYGLSFGGPVAISVAARDARVRSVVSCSGPSGGESLLRDMRTPDEWIELKQRMLADRARVASTGESELVDLTVLFPFSPEFLAKYKKLAGKGTSSMENNPDKPLPKFKLESADAIRDFHPEEAVTRLYGRPILFINGDRDNCATIDQVHDLYSRAQEPKKLILMRGCDHVDLDTGPGLATQSQHASDWFTQVLK